MKLCMLPCVLGLVVLGLAGVSSTGAGHEPAKHRSKVRPPAAPSDSSAVPVARVDSASTRYELPPVAEAVKHHPHNKIVHFPIVLSLVTLAGLWFGRHNPGLLAFARVCAWVGALAAGAAWITGLQQAGAFEGEPKAWLVLVHRNWGIATAVTLAATAILAQWVKTSPIAWVAALAASILVAVAGSLGGLLSHG